MKKAARILLAQLSFRNSFAVFMTLCGLLLLPNAQGAITIDQNPLTAQSPVPPNIELLLDDSGSMAWNFMPDLCSGSTANLAGVTCNSNGDINTQANNDALTNASNNGVYYNPTVTYSAPIKVDGTSYPNSPGLTNAYADGFTNTATSVNLTTYANTSNYSSGNYYYTNAAYETEFNNVGSAKSNVAFSTSTAALSATCAAGYVMTNTGTYTSPNYRCVMSGTQTPTCSSGTYDSPTGTCIVVAPTPSCPTGYTLTGTGSARTCSGTVTTNPTCPAGAYDTSTNVCSVAPVTCSTTYGTGYTLTNLGTSASPNYQCFYSAPANCSSGTYSSSTGTCTVTPPTPTCSSGYSFVNLGTSSAPNWQCQGNILPTCSSGTYSSSTGTCTVTAPAPTCPSGTTRSKVTGVSTYNCNASFTCSSGTISASTGTCTISATPSCPSGTTRSKVSGASIFTCNATPTCTLGGTYNATKNTCPLLAPICPSGTSTSIVPGASTYNCNSTPTCSAGSYDSTANVCVAPTPTCPSGTTLGKLTGASTFTCNATPSCSSGSYDSTANVCVVSSPTPTCSAGTTFTNVGTSGSPNYQCLATISPNCTSGTYSSSGKSCVITPPTPTCTSGSLVNTGTAGSPNYQCRATSPPACSPNTYSYSSIGGICTYPPIACPSGYNGSGNPLVCSKAATSTPTCSPGTYTSSTGLCTVTPPSPTCATSGYSITNTGTASSPNYQCTGSVTGTATCGTGTFSNTTGQCTSSGTPTKNFFQFATGPAAGPYTTYYVASTAQGCVNPPHSSLNCVTETDTSGVAAPTGVQAGVNIANWFSYYHTRILTAKSGLTSSFDKLDPTVRLGFASINGNANSSIPSTGSYTSNSVKVGGVSQFDNSCVTSTTSPCAKGQSGTQRANFWAWVIAESPSGGTALRSALNALGQYYSQAGAWQNSTSDTTRLACRQSYAIATTDGFWNDSSPPSPGNVDNTTASQIIGPNGQHYVYTAVAPFKDSTSNTLADVAMKYWVTDLQTDLDNEVPTGTADPAFWQHMTTFTLGLGFTPKNITPSTTSIDDIFTYSSYVDSSIGTTASNKVPSNFAWPTPASNSINNIADLAHAAVNGHGGFYSATSPKAFSDGIADAISRVQSRVGTGASLAANSTKLGVGTVTYQALYYTGKWNGDLMAYNVDSTSGALNSSATWTASKVLPAAASRTIMTYNPAGNSGGTKYVAFSDPVNLSTAQKAALGSTSTDQQNMINYLRGDSSLESNHAGGTYRQRSTPLGDIINSQPVYVGTPNPNLFYGKTFTGSTAYPAYAAQMVSRTPVIWVAANDGLLHAFRTSDGVEIFAYLPGSVITNGLSNLSNINYGGNSVPHKLFNDGEMTVADVYSTLPSGSSPGWRTVLVGNTGRGPAKAVYALDITDPTAPIFLWERSATDGLANSDYIGQMTGQPVIAQTADGTWSAILGNGYNSSQNKAALLQFDLMTGSLTIHATSNTTDNGLAAPVAWIGNFANSISTIAYAGDLKGNVWSFVLYNDTATTPVSTPTSSGNILFTTSDGSKAQPITAGMLAGKNPSTGDLWLFFGTGQYLTQTDLDNRDVQTWYGIIVQSATSGIVSKLGTWTGSRTAGTTNALVPRRITAQTDGTATTLPARNITVATDNDMAGKSGWFTDLVKPPSSTAQGERMVTPNQFQGSLLLGTSRIPIVSDPCSPSGSGWIMAVNPFTGGNPSALFFDLNGDQQFNGTDKLNDIPAAGIGFGSVANNPIFVGNTMLTSFDNGTISSLATAGTVGTVTRLSWRELVTH